VSVVDIPRDATRRNAREMLVVVAIFAGDVLHIRLPLHPRVMAAARGAASLCRALSELWMRLGSGAVSATINRARDERRGAAWDAVSAAESGLRISAICISGAACGRATSSSPVVVHRRRQFVSDDRRSRKWRS